MAPRLPHAGRSAGAPPVKREISQVPTRSFCTWWGLWPRQSGWPSPDGPVHVAFDLFDSLGLCEYSYFAAQ